MATIIVTESVTCTSAKDSTRAETSAITAFMISGPVDVKTSEVVEFQGTALQNSYILVTSIDAQSSCT